MLNNINRYTGYEITAILEIASNKNQDAITTAILNNINRYTVDELFGILTVFNQQDHNTIPSMTANEGYELSDLQLASKKRNQDIITTAIANNINNNIDEYSAYILKGILKTASRQNQNTIVNAIIQNIDKYRLWELGEFLEVSTNQETLIAAIANQINKNTDEYSWKMLDDILSKISSDKNKNLICNSFAKKIEQFIDQLAIDSQSAAHLKANIPTALTYIVKMTNNAAHGAVFKQALQYESSISDNSAVFYHSQKSPVYWLELLYTKLWEQKYNHKASNYLFTRFPEDQNEFANAVLQFDGQQNRALLLEKGRGTLFSDQNNLRPYLLFANYALFGNSTNRGSCSAYYFINNYNVGDPEYNNSRCCG